VSVEMLGSDLGIAAHSLCAQVYFPSSLTRTGGTWDSNQPIVCLHSTASLLQVLIRLHIIHSDQMSPNKSIENYTSVDGNRLTCDNNIYRHTCNNKKLYSSGFIIITYQSRNALRVLRGMIPGSKQHPVPQNDRLEHLVAVKSIFDAVNTIYRKVGALRTRTFSRAYPWPLSPSAGLVALTTN